MPHITQLGSNRYRVKVLSLTVVRDGSAPDPRILSTPTAVVDLMRELMPDDDREHMWALYLNAQNHLLEVYPVSTGTLTASLVHPREVFKPALLRGAASVIVVHNHPSGDPTPSREDLQLTRQLVKAAELLDLRLHDHVIIGNGTGRWVSLAQQGVL
ncbi:MAG: DNA repair protein RadC [candidate division NC10 bacterium]